MNVRCAGRRDFESEDVVKRRGCVAEPRRRRDEIESRSVARHRRRLEGISTRQRPMKHRFGHDHLGSQHHELIVGLVVHSVDRQHIATGHQHPLERGQVELLHSRRVRVDAIARGGRIPSQRNRRVDSGDPRSVQVRGKTIVITHAENETIHRFRRIDFKWNPDINRSSILGQRGGDPWGNLVVPGLESQSGGSRHPLRTRLKILGAPRPIHRIVHWHPVE